jgi:LEA14-like dessication related protein
VRHALAAAALVALVAACPGITRPLEKPIVEARGLAVTSIGLGGLDARATFAITNPNPVGLPLAAVDWELSIGGSSPIRGRVTLSKTIPAKGSAPVDVDIHIAPATAVEMISRVRSGAQDYRLAGTLHFTSKLGDIGVAFDQAGALTRP